jgi:cullin 3
MSTFQLLIVMLFNTTDVLHYGEIAGELQVDCKDLEKHILGLVHGKILLKSTKGKVITEDTEVRLNHEFQSKLYRQKIPLIQVKEKVTEQPIAIPQPVDEDRKYLIEATIVRIMKSRRTVEHNTLLTEVMKQLSHRFSPDPNGIKRRIENLLEREYMERDSENTKQYHYLA